MKNSLLYLMIFFLVSDCYSQEILSEGLILLYDDDEEDEKPTSKIRWEELCRREGIDYKKISQLALKEKINQDLECPKGIDAVYRILMIGENTIGSSHIFLKQEKVYKLIDDELVEIDARGDLIADLKMILSNPYPIKKKKWYIGPSNPATLFVEKVDANQNYEWAIRSKQATPKNSFLRVADVYVRIENAEKK